jgi:galactonate dehydratase
MAEAYEVGLAPHCPLGPISLASCLAVDSVSVNFAVQETSLGIHYNEEGSNEGGVELLDYVKNRKALNVGEDGCIARLDGPGLGLDIDEDRVRAAAEVGHEWRDREWTLPDGCPTTW